MWRGLCWGLWFPGCMMLVVYTYVTSYISFFSPCFFFLFLFLNYYSLLLSSFFYLPPLCSCSNPFCRRCKHNLPVSYGASVGSTISTALLTLIVSLLSFPLLSSLPFSPFHPLPLVFPSPTPLFCCNFCT